MCPSPHQQTPVIQTTGGGLATSDNVKNLPIAPNGPGITRAELEEKKALEAAQKKVEKEKTD